MGAGRHRPQWHPLFHTSPAVAEAWISWTPSPPAMVPDRASTLDAMARVRGSLHPMHTTTSARHVFFAGLFGAILGCAATHAAQTRYATAQTAPRADGAFRECVRWAEGLERERDIADLAASATTIPPGWTFHALTGTSGDVVLCR